MLYPSIYQIQQAWSLESFIQIVFVHIFKRFAKKVHSSIISFLIQVGGLCTLGYREYSWPINVQTPSNATHTLNMCLSKAVSRPSAVDASLLASGELSVAGTKTQVSIDSFMP